MSTSSGTAAPRYVVQAGDRVEAWSERRLPFEPRDWLLEMRTQIRHQVSQLKAGPDEVLHAVYMSVDGDFSDPENVLLYNLGPAHYRAASEHGLRFERVYREPPPFVLHPHARYEHYSSYRVAPRNAGFVHWMRGRPLAEWRSMTLRTFSSSLKPATFWMALKSTEPKTSGPTEDGVFGLALAVEAPMGLGSSLGLVTKALLDGVISAFHQHDGSNPQELGARLGHFLGETSSSVMRWLEDDTLNVLGVRPIVRPYRTGLQWNPADDRCVAAQILVSRSEARRDWGISGQLFSVTKIAHP